MTFWSPCAVRTALLLAGVAGPKEPAPTALSCADGYGAPCASPPLTGWALLAAVPEPVPQAANTPPKPSIPTSSARRTGDTVFISTLRRAAAGKVPGAEVSLNGEPARRPFTAAARAR